MIIIIIIVIIIIYMKWIADGTHWEVGKIRAQDEIWTHDPP